MANSSIWRLEGRFAGPTLFALLAVPATFFAFVVAYGKGITFSGLPVTNIVHIHTALASLWVLTLAMQAWLARSGRIPLHRKIGRASYVLAPLVFVSMAAVYIELLGRRTMPMTQFDLQVDIFNVVNPIGFILCWGLAIYHRKNTPRHMRYMISTMLAIATAITARLLLNYFSWVPGLDNFEVLLVVQGVLILLPVGWLIRRDAALGVTPSPYWLPFGLNLLLLVGYFSFTKTQWWSAMIHGFAGIWH